MTKSVADKLIQFYKNLEPPVNLPKNIEVLFPQQDKKVLEVVKIFLKKFYDDTHPRFLIFGINPGRFGAGTTGINFTAPKQLKEYCGIDFHFKNNQSELSAEFIYEMIGQYGGVKDFYRNYFIAAISPLGYTKNGLNINYYDDKQLEKKVMPFIIESIQQQIQAGFRTDCCFCVGEGKNFKFFRALNKEYHFFDEIIPLPHPRFIMQYRRRKKQEYIRQYLSVLNRR